MTFLRAYTPHAKVHSLGREAWLDFRLRLFPWPDILRYSRPHKTATLIGHCGSYNQLLLEPGDEDGGAIRAEKVTMLQRSGAVIYGDVVAPQRKNITETKYAHFLIFKLSMNGRHHSNITAHWFPQNTDILLFSIRIFATFCHTLIVYNMCFYMTPDHISCFLYDYTIS